MGGNWGGSDSKQKGRPLTAEEMNPRFYSGVYNLAKLTGGTAPEILSRDDWAKENLKPIVKTDELGNTYEVMPSKKNINKQYQRYVYGQYGQAQLNAPEYDSPEYKSIGNYDDLEKSILASRMAPLQSAWTQRQKEIDQNMADRGIYASGIGDQDKNRIFGETVLPSINQASAEATTARIGAQQKDLEGANAFNLQNAGNEFAGKTKFLDQLTALWANANGQKTSGSSSSGQAGFNI